MRAPLTFESVNWSLIFIELVAPKRAGFFGVPQSIHCRFFSFFLFSFLFLFLDKTPFNFRAIKTSLCRLVTVIYVWAVR